MSIVISDGLMSTCTKTIRVGTVFSFGIQIPALLPKGHVCLEFLCLKNFARSLIVEAFCDFFSPHQPKKLTL